MTNLFLSGQEEFEALHTLEHLKDALEFINYGIKEGFYSPEQFEGMTDQELIDFADKEEAKAEAWADSMKENGVDY